MSRFGRAAVLLMVLAASSVPSVLASTRYDPRLRFRTISTARFDIHFHQGEEAIARRLAGFVEQAAAEVDASVGAAVGRVQIVLVDQHDLSNGWATPLPYNTIEISAAAPPAAAGIGHTDDWLRVVFVHEYTHIAHLSRARGWIGGLRRGFGRHPVLFPNLFQPVWGIEGIATWQESRATGQGRVPAGDFRVLVAQAARDGRFERLDRANGGNVDWPSGTIPYAYGAYFHDYLARRYGPETIRTLADETSGRIPYLGSRAYEKVFGQTLGDLWEGFREESERQAAASRSDTSARQITHHGFTVSGPRFAADGTIYYSALSPHHFPALMRVRPGEAPTTVADRYLGNAIAPFGSHLVLDELELARSVALQSDLYLLDPRDGARRRLTNGARALDPDVSRDGIVACVIQSTDRRALATMRMAVGAAGLTPELLVDEADTYFAGPRWSPDGRSIAAERRRLGGPAEIVVVNPADRSVSVVASLPGGRSAAPVWTRDGSAILFSSAVDGAAFQLYRVTLRTGALERLLSTGPNAQSPDIAPDGGSIVYVGYTSAGHDLFTMPLASARWIEVASARTESRPTLSATDPPRAPARAYSPWRTLIPRFWTPTLESDADEIVVGAATGGVDVLGRHAFGIEAGWSQRARPDWQVVYSYDRWRPTLFAAISDDTDPWSDGTSRARELDAGLLLRMDTVRVSHATLASFHVGDDRLDCRTCPASIDRARTIAAVRLGWELASSNTFGYSVSDEEGGRYRATVEIPRDAFGADGNAIAMTVDLRRYWRTWPAHGVVAVRTAAAGSWGDAHARRVYSAAGNGPQPGGFRFGSDAVGLLRGFDEGDVSGTKAAVVNADYRAPLLRIDRGLGTLPLFVRSIHGAVFVDAAQGWNERFRGTETRVSIGAELSADAVVGFTLPVTVTAGAAWRRDGSASSAGLAAFVRVGRAF